METASLCWGAGGREQVEGGPPPQAALVLSQPQWEAPIPLLGSWGGQGWIEGCGPAAQLAACTFILLLLSCHWNHQQVKIMGTLGRI